MKLESQVCSLDLAKKLKELGVRQESYFAWVGGEIWDSTMQSDYEGSSTPQRDRWVSAFTVAELGEMLPKRWADTSLEQYWTHDGDVAVGLLTPSDGFSHRAFGKSEADARAKMLIYLLEHNILKAEEVG